MPSAPRHPRYEVLDPLGRGGAAVVWRARDRQEGRDVALKTLRSPDAESRSRFRREIELLSSIAHDGVVRLLDVGRCGEELFYTMELQTGPRLDDVIAQPPRSAADRVHGAVRIGRALLEVLAWLHGRDIVHGDLKPANVFVTPGDAGDGRDRSPNAEDAPALWHAPFPRVRLVDFGVARVVSTRPLDLVAGEGTPLYMAPEQLRGEELGPASDLWSAGVILYHLLAGRPPRSTLAEILAAREPPPCPRPPDSAGEGDELPPALAELLARLLEPRPTRRLASAAEALALIEGVLPRAEPRPRIAPRLSEPVFTGREAEVAELEAALAIAASGRNVVARLQGFAAEGKSWLFRRGPFAVRALVAWEAVLLHASLGTPERAEASFETLRQSLLAHLGAPPKKDDGDAGKPSSGGGERPHPENAPVANAAAESEAESAAEEALPLLRALADRTLIVLVVEDPASDADVLWLRRVEQILHDRAALLAVSYRPELLAASRSFAAWFRELDEKGAPPAIQLGELGDRDLARYVEGVLVPHRTPSSRLLSALSAGDRIQPAAVHRRLHDLIKRGEIRENDSGEWDLEEIASTERMGERSGPVPAHGPGDSSTPFAAMLDEPSRRLLLAAFVLGDTADPELIEELASQRDERDLVAHDQRFARSAMRDLLVAGLITHGPEGLSAAPSRELKRIIAETPPDEIRKLHGRAASILLDRARSSATPSRWSARIARHLEEAGKLDRAAKMWLEAGSVALASSRNHVALARFERALALATSPELRFESALALGDLRARSGDATGALSAYEEAEASSRSPELEDELDDRIGRVLQKLRRVDEADVRFRRTLARAGNDPLRRGRALLRLAGIAFDQHEPVEARRLYDEALPLVQLAGAVDLELAVHSGVGILDKQEGDLEHAAARFERALECAERLSRPLDTAAVLNNLGTIWRMRGRADEALRCLERSIDLRERAGDRRGLAICFTNLARIHRARGELAQAEDSTARALSIFIEVGDGKGVLIARHNIAEIAIARSRFDVALEQIRRLEEDAHGEHAGPILASAGVLRAKVESQRAGPASGIEMLDRTLAELGDADAGARARALALRSELLGSLGREDEARRNLDEASSGAEPIDDETRFELELARLRYHVRRGDLDLACEIGRDLLANVPPSAERLARALVHRELGTVYRDLGPDHADRTERHLERAIEDFELMGCPHEVADTLRRYAQYFLLLGEDQLARDCEDRAGAAVSRAEGRAAIIELSRKERSA